MKKIAIIGSGTMGNGIAQNLAVIAAEFGFRLTLCSQPELGKATGLASAKCIDGERLSDVAGRMVAAQLHDRRR